MWFISLRTLYPFPINKLNESEITFRCYNLWWMASTIYDEWPALLSLNKVWVLVSYRMRIVLLLLSNGKRFTATPTSANSSQMFFNRTFGFMWSGTANFAISVFRLELQTKTAHVETLSIQIQRFFLYIL